ncbi:MAG: hypothetical protein ACOY4D_12855, partial [Pseudomonadota bacterium]
RPENGRFGGENRHQHDQTCKIPADLTFVSTQRSFRRELIRGSLRETPDYRDKSALIFLRLLYRPRKTVHSMDLPDYASQTLY